MKKYGKKAVIAVAWILVWQLAAHLVGNRILLVGPLETLQALGAQIVRGSFWLTVGTSLLRIGAGFAAGLALGLLLAAVSGRFSLVGEVLAPVMSLLKAIPVASFVVLFLIWWRSGVLATAVSFCIVLPNIYVNTLEGIRHVDRRMLEMAEVFGIPTWNRFFYIYRPALKPYLDSAICISVGMSWKSGVAAEVIGIPALSVGEQLYLSKIYLDTAGVLAWTVVTILASVVCEKVVLTLWELFQCWEPWCHAQGTGFSQSWRHAWGMGISQFWRSVRRIRISQFWCSIRRMGISQSRKTAVGSDRGQEDIQGESMVQKGSIRDRENTSRDENVIASALVVLELLHVSKSYYGRTVLQDVTACYERGQIYYFCNPSGSGKTTLFRLIAGLEEPDFQEYAGKAAKRQDTDGKRYFDRVDGGKRTDRAGGGTRTDRMGGRTRTDRVGGRMRTDRVGGRMRTDKTADKHTAAVGRIERHGSRISMVFQEDRLCEEYNALVNVDMVTGDREKSREHLCQLLEEVDLYKPCRELSGGMKRRVAVARAMAAGGDVILLDEPFSGLDAESRCRVEQYIRSHGADSALLIATHIEGQ